MSYHQFTNEDGGPFGSFEVFETEPVTGQAYFYWWACFPGCLPDGDPNGPFKNEADAIADANAE